MAEVLKEIEIIIKITLAHQAHLMEVGRKYIRILINGSVLDNCFSTLADLNQLVQSAVEKIDLKIEAPTGHVFIEIKQIRVLVHVLKLWNPFVVLAKHFSEGCFPSTDISCYCNMFWFSRFGHNILVRTGF